MPYLTIRTDKPESEIGLFDGEKKLAYETWQAHRQLGATIHLKLDEIMQKQKMALQDVKGIVVFEGPGSFTGLRIGISVANGLSYGLQCPVVAATGDDWIRQGITHLDSGENDTSVTPHYGAPVHITQQKR
ncbi:tRNA (adenosine(37)-N6)-threonylcarbamoyltransferase complex dimerization subunit type 1 TsaB [Candidatus Saccharibacteria bacterium]|nr:tRNA (adenosine(37)-N6)-threonylcarbamoyltransferase complex dimerization subunit type 1 TsaB [Candidatus Saccharibacteria bacterium]